MKSWEKDERLISLLFLTALKADARAIDDAMAIAAAAAERFMVITAMSEETEANEVCENAFREDVRVGINNSFQHKPCSFDL